MITLIILTTIPPSYAGTGAMDIVTTPHFVGGSFKCSCGVGDYSHRYSFFLNYCPNCHHHGTLRYEEGPGSYTSPEGMWYCTVCDMDFCGQCGKEHITGSMVWLTPYHPTQKELYTAYHGQPPITLIKTSKQIKGEII